MHQLRESAGCNGSGLATKKDRVKSEHTPSNRTCKDRSDSPGISQYYQDII